MFKQPQDRVRLLEKGSASGDGLLQFHGLLRAYVLVAKGLQATIM